MHHEEYTNTTSVLQMELKCVMKITMATIVPYIVGPGMTFMQATHVQRMAVRCVSRIGVVKVATSLANILSPMTALPLLYLRELSILHLRGFPRLHLMN